MSECSDCGRENVRVDDRGHCLLCQEFCEASSQYLETENHPFVWDEQVKAMLYCATCGSKEFQVGKGTYRTTIRCPKCGWERCVHDG